MTSVFEKLGLTDDNAGVFDGEWRGGGAKIMKDIQEVKGAGAFSIITDPTGAMLGLWEPKKG